MGSWAHARTPTPKHSCSSEQIKQGHVPTSCGTPVRGHESCHAPPARRCPAGARCCTRGAGPRTPQGPLDRATGGGHHLYAAAGDRPGVRDRQPSVGPSGRSAHRAHHPAGSRPAPRAGALAREACGRESPRARAGAVATTPGKQWVMDLGRLGIWTYHLNYQPASKVREVAAELQELGYGALWIGEAAYREPLTHAGFLLSATSRMVIATGIANIWARDPFTMTAAQLTLSEAYPERFLLGLGVSHARLVQGIRGHKYQQPFTAMRRYLDG